MKVETLLPKELSRALSSHETFAKALFERPESLSHFLPYDEFLPDFGVFRQKDGSLGVVYEVELCEHETKTSQEIVRLLEDLRSWFRLGEDLTLSILFDQSQVSAHDPFWQEQTAEADLQRADIPAKLHLSAIERYRNPSESGDPIRVPFRRRLYLSIRIFPKRGTALARMKDAGKELGNPDRTLSNELEGFLKQLRSFNHSLSQFELTSPLRLKRLNAVSLADFLRRSFNPVTYFKRPFAPVNPGAPLSEQIAYCSSTLDYPGIEREGMKTRTITLKNAPSFAYPGAMAYFLGLEFPFRISINVSFPSSSAIKRHFGIKDFFLQNTPSARSRQQKAEIESLQERLLRDDRVLNMTFCVLLEASSEEELDRQTKECLARFQQRLECEAIVESEIGLGLWLNALPLNYHPIADYTAKRSIRILASDIAQFCPVFDSFRGTPSSQSLFQSREGGLVPFALKSVGSSHMTAVLGDTGSGKSGQVIKLLLGELRRDPKPLIFVIDYKTSYGMVSRYVPSELTTFERGKSMPFSPFRGELDEDKLRFLVQLLSTAMHLTSHEFHLDSEHRTCLTQAVRTAYETKAKTAGIRYLDGDLVASADMGAAATVTLDDVVAALGGLTGKVEFEKYGLFVDEITKKLRPFYGDGIYAPFFRKKDSEKVALNADLFVYDLDGLASDPVLQTLVTMSVIDEIRRRIARPEARERGGFIVIEELGMLGRNNPTAKDFVIDAAETFRKLGYFLIGLTPNPRNYFELPAGQAMWAVADHYLFLSMKEDNVDFIAKNSGLLDEASIQIVKSLKSVRGQFAECFYVHKSKAVSGAFRNVPSAHELWLMPTHLPDNVEAQKTLKRFPGDPVAALEDLVSRYPAGTKDVQTVLKEGSE